MSESAAGRELPRERILRLVAEGKMPHEAVMEAEALWQARLRDGVVMPNGERIVVTLNDLYHAIVDPRIWRKSWRIEQVLAHVFEIRTAREGRRMVFSRWQETDRTLLGYAIIAADHRAWSLHVIDERRMRRLMQEGEVLWRQSERP